MCERFASSANCDPRLAAQPIVLHWPPQLDSSLRLSTTTPALPPPSATGNLLGRRLQRITYSGIRNAAFRTSFDPPSTLANGCSSYYLSYSGEPSPEVPAAPSGVSSTGLGNLESAAQLLRLLLLNYNMTSSSQERPPSSPTGDRPQSTGRNGGTQASGDPPSVPSSSRSPQTELAQVRLASPLCLSGLVPA